MKKDEDHPPGHMSIFGLDEEVRRVYRVHLKLVIVTWNLRVRIIDMGFS